MHAAAFGFVSRVVFGDLMARMALRYGAAPPPLGVRRAVVELGSLDINGSVRQLFMGTHYLGVDMQQGPGVDAVADAADFDPPFSPDTVVCCEVLEHAHAAREIVENAHRMLAPGGVFIMTCAGDGREPHSAVDGGPLEYIAGGQGMHYRSVDTDGADGHEFYKNISEAEMEEWLAPFQHYIVDADNPGDLYAVAWKATGDEDDDLTACPHCGVPHFPHCEED